MIRIICVGKIKEQYLNDAIKEYQKRLTKYTKEIKDESKYSEKENMAKEAVKIKNYIKEKDYNIALAIEGKMLTSPEFAKCIDETFNNYSNINFIIGGSYGIDDSVKNMCNLKISFSKMTYPHQLFRVILLEQIYRAFKINNNESYHK